MNNTYKVNEEAVKKIAERVYDNGTTVINRNDLEEMFPTLKESEDERTWIINYLSNRILNSTIIAEKENLKRAIAWLEKQGEQNLANSAKTCKDEQKPAEWSKDDEDVINHLLAICDGAKRYRRQFAGCLQEDITKYQTWLKSLKDRVGNFDDGYKVGFSAAKHTYWKPSEEQMDAIKDAIDYLCGNTKIVRKYLMSLYEDLKKLLEE